MDGITLVLDRVHKDLWVRVNGVDITCLWDVTGLSKDKESYYNHVRILRNGKQIGGFWHVSDIKEKW